VKVYVFVLILVALSFTVGNPPIHANDSQKYIESKGIGIWGFHFI